MNKTKIDWCDRTWNPVTGCLHGCGYCFARSYARRFGGAVVHKLDERQNDIVTMPFLVSENSLVKLEEPLTRITKSGNEVKAPYPAGFNPTFHAYRLGEPKRIKQPQKTFVTDCGDLFGKWVPDEWIRQVFQACAAAQWHRYIFLTKSFWRYEKVKKNGLFNPSILPISVFGISATDDLSASFALNSLAFIPKPAARLLCLEPMLKEISVSKYELNDVDWVIVGAETGNRKGKITPERAWVQKIVDTCRAAGTPVFLKGNLAAVWGEDLIQEYPEVLKINLKED